MKKGKPKPRPPTISLDKYVSTAKPRKVVRCETCRTCSPEMLADIKRIAEMRKSGELAIAVPQVFEEFLVPNGFKGTAAGLANHIRGCLGIRIGR